MIGKSHKSITILTTTAPGLTASKKLPAPCATHHGKIMSAIAPSASARSKGKSATMSPLTKSQKFPSIRAQLVAIRSHQPLPFSPTATEGKSSAKWTATTNFAIQIAPPIMKVSPLSGIAFLPRIITRSSAARMIPRSINHRANRKTCDPISKTVSSIRMNLCVANAATAMVAKERTAATMATKARVCCRV